jgi:hypothetical protein
MNLLFALLVVIVTVPRVVRLLSLAHFFSQKELLEDFQQARFPKRDRLMYNQKRGYYSVYR